MNDQSIEILYNFLARKDVTNLENESFDLIILLGNSILEISRTAFDLYKSGHAKKLLISGGIGHATSILAKNLNITKITNEAEALADLASVEFGISRAELMMETHSTNCASNATETKKILEQHNIFTGRVLLLQDPFMQRRTHAGFEKVFVNSSFEFISYALPVDKNTSWEKDRFISLLMGEIPRFEKYGPNGTNEILFVEIPQQVLKAYQNLLTIYKLPIR